MNNEVDYKRLYEEALERAYAEKEADSSCRKQIYRIFPQLANEQERKKGEIRKVIENSIEREFKGYLSCNGVTKAECLEWMGNQSDWKPCEEQLEYLDKAIDKLSEIGYLWCAGKLKWLREDLRTKL